MKHTKTYKSFVLSINEGSDFKTLDLNNVLKIINSKCKQWVNGRETNTPLLRVIRSTDDFIQIESVNRESITGIQTNVIFDSLKSWDEFPSRSKSTFCRSVSKLDKKNIGEQTILSSNNSCYVVIPYDNSDMCVCFDYDFNYSESWPNLANLVKTKNNMILATFFDSLGSCIIKVFKKLPESSESKELIDGARAMSSGYSKFTPALFKKLLKSFDFVYKSIGDQVVADKQHKELLYSYYNSKKPMIDWIDDLLNPKANKFGLGKYTSNFKIDKDREVYTDGKCVLVKIAKEIENSPYHQLIKNLD